MLHLVIISIWWLGDLASITKFNLCQDYLSSYAIWSIMKQCTLSITLFPKLKCAPMCIIVPICQTYCLPNILQLLIWYVYVVHTYIYMYVCVYVVSTVTILSHCTTVVWEKLMLKIFVAGVTRWKLNKRNIFNNE